MFSHMLGIVPVGVLFHNIYSSLLFLFFYTPSAAYSHSGQVSAYLSPNQSSVSLMFYITAICDLCTSTLWAQTKNSSLFTSMVSFSTVNSLIILAMMASSFMPLMKFSFCLLSFSLNLEFGAFTHNLPIHSCVDTSLFQLSLQYCNKI